MKAKKARPISKESAEFLKKIGSKMSRQRKALGYKNSDAFAYDNEINRSQYGKYEAGSQDMRISSLLKTIKLLGLSVDDLLTDRK